MSPWSQIIREIAFRKWNALLMFIGLAAVAATISMGKLIAEADERETARERPSALGGDARSSERKAETMSTIAETAASPGRASARMRSCACGRARMRARMWARGRAATGKPRAPRQHIKFVNIREKCSRDVNQVRKFMREVCGGRK